MKIELIKCFEDTTWETEVFEIPDNYLEIKNDEGRIDTDENIHRFINKEFRDATLYRDVIYWGIYNYSPEEND